MSHTIINAWKSIINTGNHKGLVNIIHENATFYSPVVHSPQEGKKRVIKYLSTAVEVFKGKNFCYTNNVITDNIKFYAEFNASFDKIEVNGIDFIKCENNLIKEFKVFLRPLKGIEVVWNEMKIKLMEYDNNLSQQ